MMNTYAQTAGKVIRLENPEGTRSYTFYTNPVKRSNVDDTIVGYQCVIEYAQRLSLGSSHSTRYVSKTVGNNTYKELLSKGLIKVEAPSFA